jgi:chemotaxis protein methyltransferase CheR
MLTRARAACYPASSLKDLPPTWRTTAFSPTGEEYCLRPEFRTGVDFRCQDIRTEQPAESFHLILCRNLVFTYFGRSLQQQMLAKITGYLLPGGGLVIGKTEQLPQELPHLTPWLPNLKIYRYLGT